VPTARRAGSGRITRLQGQGALKKTDNAGENVETTAATTVGRGRRRLRDAQWLAARNGPVTPQFTGPDPHPGWSWPDDASGWRTEPKRFSTRGWS